MTFPLVPFRVHDMWNIAGLARPPLAGSHRDKEPGSRRTRNDAGEPGTDGAELRQKRENLMGKERLAVGRAVSSKPKCCQGSRREKREESPGRASTSHNPREDLDGLEC